jgi:hypothetical protein
MSAKSLLLLIRFRSNSFALRLRGKSVEQLPFAGPDQGQSSKRSRSPAAVFGAALNGSSRLVRFYEILAAHSDGGRDPDLLQVR